MLGEILAIISAITSAGSIILAVEAVKGINPIRSNTIRVLFSMILMLPIAVLSGEFNNIYSINFESLLLVILAAIVGIGIGDSLLYKSFNYTEVSLASTIAYIYPLFTVLIEVLLLGETFYSIYLIGTVLIVCGVILVLYKRRVNKVTSIKGYTLAFIVAIAWAVGASLVGVGLNNISVILANVLRFPIIFLFLFLLSEPKKRWNLRLKDLILLSSSGILGLVIGGITFLFSVQLIGTSRAVPLSSSSPLWISLMSLFILKEKVTFRLIIASIFVVIGIYLLTE